MFFSGSQGENVMQLWQLVTIGVAAAVVVAILGWVLYERRRTNHLRGRFGPEYDRAVTDIGNRRRAESALQQRETRARELRSRPLSISDRDKFVSEWKMCQVQFVDDPAGAVEEADRVVSDIMRTRGYTVDNPYDRAADIAAAYPDRSDSYREATGIISSHHRGRATTEDLRRAFIYYRELFDEILEGHDEERKRA
jgi:hypothetical protein